MIEWHCNGEKMTDIEIANSIKFEKIEHIAKKLGLNKKDIELYGDYKAKIKTTSNARKTLGKLILVTAINPTSAGEGKTTVSIGLADSLASLNKNVCLSLREPSLGPVFGLKGGATGGGYAQVVPMEDINLHFTGDFHAITSANNLLCSFIDNHIYFGNELNINPQKVVFNRCLDLNDRALREVDIATTEKCGIKRHEKFNITASSEIMAILCLSKNLNDLKNRLSNILVGFTFDDKPVYARDLKAQDAMAILLKDAIKPNLVQTLFGTPAIVHGGPFANIAHGCSSIIATKTSMQLADYTVTEAGFGADLGAEKFLDLKCRLFDLHPDVAVVVATVRALKMHGGADKNNLNEENMACLEKGMGNLKRHLLNLKTIYNLQVVCAINKFSTDSEKELAFVKKYVEKLQINAVVTNSYEEGKTGAIELAQKILKMCEEEPKKLNFPYDETDSIEEKVRKVAQKIYGAKDVEFSKKAIEDFNFINNLGLSNYPVIIAKTQYSFSDDAKLLGAPSNFTIKIRRLEIKNGAKFIVAIAGSILLMPGLPKVPAGAKMTINDGVISGLF